MNVMNSGTEGLVKSLDFGLSCMQFPPLAPERDRATELSGSCLHPVPRIPWDRGAAQPQASQEPHCHSIPDEE